MAIPVPLGELHEQALDDLQRVAVGRSLLGIIEAISETGGDKLEAGLFKRFGCRRDLGDNVPALPAVGEHLFHPLDLAGDPAQAFADVLYNLRRQLHFLTPSQRHIPRLVCCTSMPTYQETLDELRKPTLGLRHAQPEAWAGFKQLHDAAMADGALPRRTKELIALAIAVVKGCDGCIASHAKGAARNGATPEEVAETLSVTMLMDGGPATVYGPRAWGAFEEFHPPT